MDLEKKIIINDVYLVHVGIADMKFGKSPEKLKTVLGSCVGICVYYPRLKIGALAHAMLPQKHSNIINEFKFVDTSIERMIKNFEKLKISSCDLQAKIFGGAKIYFSDTAGILPDIGKMNVEMARKMLKKFNIKIIAEDVFGDLGRTIIFDLQTGNVLSRLFSGVEKCY
ncbi:MAG: chemotaxis protein CheD [Spirochaetes bacterium]|nr:chemotaxis protein CheD [Spirochaetota bacterium]